MSELLGIWRETALIAAVVGILLLWDAWRRRGNRPFSIPIGWSLIIYSIIGWSQTSGTDKGTALGIIVAVLVGGTMVSLVAVFTSVREARKSAGHRAAALPPNSLGFIGWVRRVFVGMLIGPFSMFAAISLSTGLFSLLRTMGTEHSANLTLVMFLFPLSWAVLAVIGGSDKKLWRKSVVILGTALIPASALYFTA